MNRVAKIGLYFILLPRPDWMLPNLDVSVEPQPVGRYEGFAGEVSSLSAHIAAPLSWNWVSSISWRTVATRSAGQ